MKSIIAALVLTTVSTEVYAASARMVYEACETGNALYYVTGVRDAMVFTEDLDMCIPVGVDNGQLKEIVCQYLKSNPKVWHRGGAAATYVALKDAFPCSRK